METGGPGGGGGGGGGGADPKDRIDAALPILLAGACMDMESPGMAARLWLPKLEGGGGGGVVVGRIRADLALW